MLASPYRPGAWTWDLPQAHPLLGMPPWLPPMLLWPLSALVVVVLVSIATIARSTQMGPPAAAGQAPKRSEPTEPLPSVASASTEDQAAMGLPASDACSSCDAESFAVLRVEPSIRKT